MVTAETEANVEAEPEENWLVLLDPAWEPADDEETPPLEVVVGFWPVERDGHTGRFRGNPGYRPLSPDSPSDPLDAVLRLMVRGAVKTPQLQAMLRGCLVDVAMNGDGRPLVMKSPDDKLCAVVATGEPHRARVSSPDWLRVDVDGLVRLLDREFDVLVNPGGPAAVRLAGGFIRSAAELGDDELAAIHATFRDNEHLDTRLSVRLPAAEAAG